MQEPSAAPVPAPRKLKRRAYRRHGHYLTAITPEERAAIAAIRSALVAHCGGLEAISEPRKILVDLAAAAAIRVQRTNAYLSRMANLVDGHRHREWPVVEHVRQAEAHLMRLLIAIGLEPKAKPVMTIRQMAGLPD